MFLIIIVFNSLQFIYNRKLIFFLGINKISKRTRSVELKIRPLIISLGIDCFSFFSYILDKRYNSLNDGSFPFQSLSKYSVFFNIRDALAIYSKKRCNSRVILVVVYRLFYQRLYLYLLIES